MTWRTRFLAAPAVAFAALLAMPAAGLISPAHAACAPGDKINASTAEWAAEQAREAGYSNISMQRKGCDNYWHGIGSKDGQTGRFVVSPDGEVLPEGD
ncbi:hypothetical protein [Emcibacter sp. SYSU 3D8]|uniref:hypothetical protein n=1 Tax=Emcibacter sp. SYSU 3D8 TaxID=3133969 RepID=UPI0031FEAA4E